MGRNGGPGGVRPPKAPDYVRFATYTPVANPTGRGPEGRPRPTPCESRAASCRFRSSLGSGWAAGGGLCATPRRKKGVRGATRPRPDAAAVARRPREGSPGVMAPRKWTAARLLAPGVTPSPASVREGSLGWGAEHARWRRPVRPLPPRALACPAAPSEQTPRPRAPVIRRPGKCRKTDNILTKTPRLSENRQRPVREAWAPGSPSPALQSASALSRRARCRPSQRDGRVTAPWRYVNCLVWR